MAQNGYFVIADITGYTAFLTGSELDHAQDILKTLFDTLLDNIHPPLLISNFQGDAILTYAAEGSFALGQTLLEAVEGIYCAFAHKLELMQRNTTCPCRACANIPKLDLKLFVHHGEYILQDMGGKAELSGPDVIIAHRMMKNEVKEKTGLKAYTLFTEAAVNALGLQEFTCEMTPHNERYDHIGEVKMYAYCLKTMWEKEREKRRVIVQPDESWFTLSADLPAPPPAVWDYLNEPERRRELMDVEGVTVSGAKNGRLGVGSIYHCAHGAPTTVDILIVDWKPFEYMTEEVSGLPMKMVGRFTTQLTPMSNGTRMKLFFAAPRSTNAILDVVCRIMRPMLKKMISSDYEKRFTKLRAILEERRVSSTVDMSAPSTSSI